MEKKPTMKTGKKPAWFTVLLIWENALLLLENLLRAAWVWSEITPWSLDTEGRERPKKGADHPRLGGGRFTKQRNLHVRLDLSSCKMSSSPHTSARILKVYIETVTGFSHVFILGGFNTTFLFQGCTLGAASGGGEGSTMQLPRTGAGASLRVSWRSCPLDGFLQWLCAMLEVKLREDRHR